MKIEVKIPVDVKVFDALVKEMTSFAIHETKKSTYYSKYGTFQEREQCSEPMICIRDDGCTQTLTLKRKSEKDKIEINEEVESKISNSQIAAVTALLQLEQYKAYFVKEKESWGWGYTVGQKDSEPIRLNCKLICVNNLKYLEIKSAGCNRNETATIEALKKCATFYNLNYDNRDDRSWAEILSEEKS